MAAAGVLPVGRHLQHDGGGSVLGLRQRHLQRGAGQTPVRAHRNRCVRRRCRRRRARQVSPDSPGQFRGRKLQRRDAPGRLPGHPIVADLVGRHPGCMRAADADGPPARDRGSLQRRARQKAAPEHGLGQKRGRDSQSRAGVEERWRTCGGRADAPTEQSAARRLRIGVQVPLSRPARRLFARVHVGEHQR